MHSARTRKINNNTKNNMQADPVDGGRGAISHKTAIKTHF